MDSSFIRKWNGNTIMTVENALSNQFLNEVENYSTKSIEATIGKNQEKIDIIRSCKVGWINSKEVKSKVSKIVEILGKDVFGYDMFEEGIEPIQYTTYSYNKNRLYKDHYNWHMDSSFEDFGNTDRKLSFSLQLSEPEEYGGCNLEFFGAKGLDKNVFRAKGTLVIFPSFMYHKVTPIERGVRKVLVGWVRGPKFK